VFTIKKKIALIVLLIFTLLFILGKNYISELAKLPSIRIHLINIAKVVIPLKNLILIRNVDDKIVLLKSSGACIFCDITQGDFKGNDLKGVNLRYAILIEANLSNTNLSKANLSNTNLSKANLSNTNLSNANLRNTNLNGTILTYANLSGANLNGVDLSNKDLTGTILTYTSLTGANLNGVDLSNKDLTRTILTGVDLSNKDLTGTILTYANLTETNLDGVDLSNKDLTGTILTYANLTGANLDGVDLSNKDLTGTILTYANLTGANLNGVDLSNKDLTGTILTYANLTGANLDGVDLSNKDLTGTIIKDIFNIKISLKNPSNSNWLASNEIQNLNVTRYDLTEGVQYIATKEGILFESKNNESRLVLDLNNDAQFPFYNGTLEGGFLGVASQNNLVYVSYTSQDIVKKEEADWQRDGLLSIVVDEYSENFSEVRNIIKIEGFEPTQFGGNLLFDSLGRLYLSVGDGKSYDAQNLNLLRGKILRLDVSKLKLETEIVAYGIRNPWGVTIDSKDRMFIVQCGQHNNEAIYLLNDLYSDAPVNLGWPVFEGSIKMKQDSLMFKEVLAPIFEYNNRPGCLTGGIYLNDIELFLFTDFYGTIGLLKQQENGEWFLLHKYKKEDNPDSTSVEQSSLGIWGLGFDQKTKKIFIAPKNLELEILVEQVKLNQ